MENATQFKNPCATAITGYKTKLHIKLGHGGDSPPSPQ